MTLKPEHAKVSAYFNYDNGTGRIRGVYLQQNVQAAPIFEAWMKPFADLGMTQLSPRSTMGSDHGALDLVGIPAFQWIQDPIDYSTRVHHSNLDVFDHLVPEDLIQSAVITASFVYHAAMRDGMLPRKPLPPPYQVSREEIEKNAGRDPPIPARQISPRERARSTSGPSSLLFFAVFFAFFGAAFFATFTTFIAFLTGLAAFFTGLFTAFLAGLAAFLTAFTAFLTAFFALAAFFTASSRPSRV